MMYSGTQVLCSCTPRSVPGYLHIISCTLHAGSLLPPLPSASYPLDFGYQTWPRFQHWGLIKCLHLPRSGSFSRLLPAVALASFKSRGEQRKKARDHHWVYSFTPSFFLRIALFTHSSVCLTQILRLHHSCNSCRLRLFFDINALNQKSPYVFRITFSDITHQHRPLNEYKPASSPAVTRKEGIRRR